MFAPGWPDGPLSVFQNPAKSFHLRLGRYDLADFFGFLLTFTLLLWLLRAPLHTSLIDRLSTTPFHCFHRMSSSSFRFFPHTRRSPPPSPYSLGSVAARDSIPPMSDSADHHPVSQPRLRIALAHDWLCGYRGGEAVLDRIARLILHHHTCAGLWVMTDDCRPITPTIDALPRTTSFLQHVPLGPTRLRRWLLPLFPAAVSDLSRSLQHAHHTTPIDLLISTSSAAIKGIRPPKGVPHLCYCHAPARYIWSIPDEYKRASPFHIRDRLRDAGLALATPFLKRWDVRSSSTVNLFLANSTHTQHQIKRCYNRDSRIVFPPVRTTFFTPSDSKSREPFWLIAGALEPYKRVDLAIAAANAASHQLVIVGDGSARRSLQRSAGPTVRFLGRVDDATLRELYMTASVLLFPQVEDFGIVAVEAQACGLPVVARARGGALDSVVPGVSGTLFHEPSPHALLNAIASVPAHAHDACRPNALRFSESAFDDAILRAISDVTLTHRTPHQPAIVSGQYRVTV